MSYQLSRRFRRLRSSENIRRMVRETHVSTDDLVYPLFVDEGIDEPVEIKAMPGVYRYPESMLADKVKETEALGIPAILLFGISHHKDNVGSDSWNEEGLLARMVSIAKKAAPEMVIIADTCFCEYTDHGHCGVMDGHTVDNDLTLDNLKKQAVNAANAGADIIAPSSMMDGQVLAIREGLDEAGFLNTPIMSYSTKFASAFYGPFREAAGCELKGDRKTYQMGFHNAREAIAESMQDEAEGADILMVKPGGPYLDVLKEIRESTLLPLCVYHVSGEYSMLKLAGQNGILDEKRVVMEMMTSFKRAGADMIITYYAPDIAKWLNEGSV